MPERALQGVGGQFGDLPGHFDAGGAGTDHGERQQLGPSFRIAGPFGLFERAQDPSPHLERVVDRLHARARTRRNGRCRSTTGRRRRRRSGCHTGFRRCGRASPTRRTCPPRSMCVTSPSNTWTLRCLRRTTRVGGAMSPSETMPVATWYSNGWNRWWVVRAISLDVDVGVLELLCRVESAESRSDDDDSVTTFGSSCGFWLRAHVSATPDGTPDGARQLATTLVRRLPETQVISVCNQPHGGVGPGHRT